VASARALFVLAPLAAFAAGCSLLVNTGGLDTEAASGDSSVPVDAPRGSDAPRDGVGATRDGGHTPDSFVGHRDAESPPDSARDAPLRPVDAHHAPDSGPDAPHESKDAPADSPVDASPAQLTIDMGFPQTTSQKNSGSMTVARTFDASADRLLVVVLVSGQHGGSGVWPVTLAGAGLTWASAIQTISNPQYSDAVGVGIWTAWTETALSGQTVTATRSNSVSADALLAVYSFVGASPTLGATGGTNGFGADAGALSVTVAAQAAGSIIVGGLLDGDSASGLRGTALSDTIYDGNVASSSGDSLAIARLHGATSGPGSVTIGQSASFPYDVTAGVEILRR